MASQKEPQFGSNPPAGERLPFWRTPWPWAFLVGALSLVAIRPLQDAVKTAPPPLVRLGAWQLTDHEGNSFSSKNLAGKVWIANFVFTRCPSICPKLTQNMKKMHDSMSNQGERVQFVSFTVDPSYDRPSVLRGYRAKMDIAYPNWVFLTGSQEEVHDLLVKKFFLPVGEKKMLSSSTGAKRVDAGAGKASASEKADLANQLYDISHSSKFVLFDQNGDLRAYANADPLGMGSLANAARLLVQQGPNP